VLESNDDIFDDLYTHRNAFVDFICFQVTWKN